jgi:hypothetical protein
MFALKRFSRWFRPRTVTAADEPSGESASVS